MSDFLFIPGAIVYLIVVGALFVYGINFFYLTYLTLRKRNEHLTPPEMKEWPMVTVQLPIYNELYVAERLIMAVAALDYPPALLEIQVLDDSTDETVIIVRQAVKRVRARGINIVHIHRTDREGYKAGALAQGTSAANGVYFAIFDADFIPHPDFLMKTLPYFQDEQIGFIQTRWGHVNRDYSFLTTLQSLSVDAHFMVEQFARSQAGYWFNFNGTAGIWRRKALEEAGGWTAETLTEDLDLSYRAFLCGWRAIYLRDVETRAELPVSFNAYRRQQHRWARGSLECAYKFLPKIWSRHLALRTKIEATFHLTGYAVHLLLCSLVILYPIVLFLSRQYSNLISLFGIAFLFNATAFAPTIFFIVAQQQLGNRWLHRIPAILFISALGAGMMLNTVRAAVNSLSTSKGAFERTPKFGIINKGQDWISQRYQLKLDPIVFFELLFAGLNAYTFTLAIQMQNWFIAFYSALFFSGLVFTSGLTILQTIILSLRKSRLSLIKI